MPTGLKHFYVISISINNMGLMFTLLNPWERYSWTSNEHMYVGVGNKPALKDFMKLFQF